VPRRPNLHWPKASAPTRGSWACSPTMALCRGALLRAWHMIATWTVPARFFFQNPRPKEADSLRRSTADHDLCQTLTVHLDAVLCETSTR
jgi:hypothetical protein